MGIAEDIISARDCGVVRCGLSSHISPSISELATEFGLADDPGNYKEIDRDAARRLVRLVLNQDLAYKTEIISGDHAAELTDRFLSQFGVDGVKFYTNGTFHETLEPKLTWSDSGWNPVTEATFDTGVLIIGLRCSGCLWVEDED